MRDVISANPNPSKEWVKEAIMRPWTKDSPTPQDWAEYSAAIYFSLRILPNREHSMTRIGN